MYLQVDDVFRMVEMTLLLGVLTPLSIRWMTHCWHVGIHVHRFITVIYFVDIVRRHSHPHSWVLNTPIFVLWIIDKALCMIWRQVKFPSVFRQTISDDYIVLYWTNKTSDTFNGITAVGSNYFMKMNPSSWVESPHPFTSFKNRAGNCNFMYTGLEQEEERHSTNGAVIRTFRNARKPRIGGEDRSHTGRMAEDSPSSLSIWGPFQGHLTNLVRNAFPTEGDGYGSAQERSIVLAGSGSAINFMIDLLSSETSREAFDLRSDKLQQIILLYSTRDRALYEWVTGVMDNLLGAVDMKFKDIDKRKIRILLACTADKSKETSVVLDRTFELGDDLSLHDYQGQGMECDREELSSSKEEDMEANLKQSHLSGSIELHSKRLNYTREIPCGSYVFCQGSAGFKAVVAAGCRGKKGTCLYLD